MAEVLLYELPKVVTSVFVLVPKTAEEKEFVTVTDKDKGAGKKLPGGGASKDRAIPSSAQAEVFEETHLVINPPTQKVLEVHKADKDGHPHHLGGGQEFACGLLRPTGEEAIRTFLCSR